MAKAQGSLEYLILIAVALGILSTVVLVATNYLGGQQGTYSISNCKNAAANCKVALLANPNDKCSSCDTACKKTDGTEIFPNAITCCKVGFTDSIYEGATGAECASFCVDDSECSSPTSHCCNHQCAICCSDTHCSTPTPYCVNNQCVACRDNNDCSLGYVCSNGACVLGCDTDAKCPTGQLCCNGQCKTPTCKLDTDCPYSGNLSCVSSRTCVNPNTCAATCDVKYQSTGYTCAPSTTTWSCKYAKGAQSWTVETKTTYACDSNHLCVPTTTVNEYPCDCSTCYMGIDNVAYCKSTTEICSGSSSGDWCGYSITENKACYCYPAYGGTLVCKTAS